MLRRTSDASLQRLIRVLDQVLISWFAESSNQKSLIFEVTIKRWWFLNTSTLNSKLIHDDHMWYNFYIISEEKEFFIESWGMFLSFKKLKFNEIWDCHFKASSRIHLSVKFGATSFHEQRFSKFNFSNLWFVQNVLYAQQKGFFLRL